MKKGPPSPDDTSDVIIPLDVAELLRSKLDDLPITLVYIRDVLFPPLVQDYLKYHEDINLQFDNKIEIYLRKKLPCIKDVYYSEFIYLDSATPSGYREDEHRSNAIKDAEEAFLDIPRSRFWKAFKKAVERGPNA
ncbi:hypothetical protein KKG41_02760 [Patescibacteria group bacterium]|nr:hypothetical protein [Patescibacteria group bacterium]MBU1890057.1 hypothetical protein [Patescibacteria group bacterium]